MSDMKTKTSGASRNLDAKYSFRIPTKMAEAMEALWGAQAPRMVRQLIGRRLGGFDRSHPDSSQVLEANEPTRRIAVHMAGCDASLGRLVDIIESLPKERLGIFRNELSGWMEQAVHLHSVGVRLLELHLPRSRRGLGRQILATKLKHLSNCRRSHQSCS
jgi:hypothetical protein